MELLIDNTGLHSAGRCLQGIGENDTDLEGLLQLASQLVFADRILVSTFEAQGVRESSFAVRQNLFELGLPMAAIKFIEMPLNVFQQCCLKSAERLGADLEFCFSQSGMDTINELEVSVPNLKGDDKRTFNNVQRAIELGLSDSERQEIKTHAFLDMPYQTQIFMLVASERLWNATCRLARNRNWTMQDTCRIIVHMRYYLNQEIAANYQSSYSPAVARARLVKIRLDYMLSSLNDVLAEAANDIGAIESPYPSIAGAIAQRAKGDVAGLVTEVVRIREAAAPLRDLLRGKNHLQCTDCFQDFRDFDREIFQLRSLLRKDLRIDTEPPLKSAFEFQFLGFIPIPNILRFMEWVSFQSRRKRVSVLSEFALSLKHQELDPFSVDRLRRACLKKHK